MKPFIFLTFIILASCSSTPSENQISEWKEEIRQAEAEFNAMADSLGIAAAFEAFAAEEAVLLRGDQLIEGRETIAKLYSSQPSEGKLTWSPDYIDVAQSGDLGYTYGKYIFTTTDSTGNEISRQGYFHTVWKRQMDGTWKYVWD